MGWAVCEKCTILSPAHFSSSLSSFFLPLPHSLDSQTSNFKPHSNDDAISITTTMLRLTKLKPLSPPPSSLSSSAHQLLQRCSVSRTAKGKGKAGQTLKRSKVTTRKPGSEPTPGIPTGSKEKQERERLYDQCLNAPTPLRFLKPKQREREAERERLGLISKDRQRELDMMKKKNQKFRVSEKPIIIGTPGLDYITLGLVDAEKLPKYELTAEDGKKLAKEYSRVLMKKHRARQAAETTLLRLKKEAIEALPGSLKEAALVPDLSPFPVNRVMASLTPPIEGYIEKIREAANKISGKEKIR